jgi:hypothetical protein
MGQTEALYDDAQANEILRTAVRLAAPSEISFEEIVLAAAELGISRDDLQDAEAKYKLNSSEEGQKAEFRSMQDHEFRHSAFHAGLIALIGALLIIFEVPEMVWYLLSVMALGISVYLIQRYRRLHNEKSTTYQQSFHEWQKKKSVWLRPERAKEIVDAIFESALARPGHPTDGPLGPRIVDHLRDRLGYDKKRARAVFEAYVREHPEVEALLGS